MVTQTAAPPGADAPDIGGRSWQSLAWAQRALDAGPSEVWELIRGGVISAVVLDGHTWVDRAAVMRRVAEKVDQTLNIAAELREVLSVSLRAYFEANPATGEWALARSDGRPVVSSRRGRRQTWQRYGLEFHNVGFSFSRFYAWTVRNRPDAAAVLPTERTCFEALLALDGLEPMVWITALNDPGNAHRVKRWVKVDPNLWPVRLDEATSDQVAGPTGADYVDGLAALPVPDESTADEPLPRSEP